MIEPDQFSTSKFNFEVEFVDPPIWINQPVTLPDQPTDQDKVDVDEDSHDVLTLTMRADGSCVSPPPYDAEFEEEKVPMAIEKSTPPPLVSSRELNTRHTTQLMYTYEEIPIALRTTLEPHFKTAKNKSGYSHVHSNAGGFQVQYWKPNYGGTLRLGFVRDARVGALTYTAAEVDSQLLSGKSAGRDWLEWIMTGKNREDADFTASSQRALQWLQENNITPVVL